MGDREYTHVRTNQKVNGRVKPFAVPALWREIVWPPVRSRSRKVNSSNRGKDTLVEPASRSAVPTEYGPNVISLHGGAYPDVNGRRREAYRHLASGTEGVLSSDIINTNVGSLHELTRATTIQRIESNTPPYGEQQLMPKPRAQIRSRGGVKDSIHTRPIPFRVQRPPRLPNHSSAHPPPSGSDRSLAALLHRIAPEVRDSALPSCEHCWFGQFETTVSDRATASCEAVIDRIAVHLVAHFTQSFGGSLPVVLDDRAAGN